MKIGLTKAQKARRRKFIGGSDARIIASGDQEAILRLWKEKRGEAEPEDLSDVLPVMMGSFTEPFNIHWFEKQTGKKVSRQGEQMVCPNYAFMGCTLDGFIEEELALLECKHCSGFEEMAVISARYAPQIQHALFVLDRQVAYLSVFFGSHRWGMAKFDADPFYQAALVEQEEKFWIAVKTGETPPGIILPPPPMPLEDMRTVDMTGSNEWADLAGTWLENRPAAKRFDEAASGLKALVSSDVREASGHGVKITRTKRGLSIKEG